ncbi:MAG: hypothetical protein JXR77_19175 [Lentisphaeria bacterium]|nr:hypothetical protein [Lentisphaeria bacterium]
MIEIELHHAFVLLTAILLALLYSLSLYDAWRARVRGWDLTEDQLGECVRCHTVFIAGRSETVIRCPRCGSLCPSSRRGDSASRTKGR